ncbi:hypothetical protein ACE1CD_06675 [Aerosakkonema sp. BLCC-F183]|uniref:hypothetical protein n=1 Tax=Aerosakkonema sp. BLCC-F183 TaxID=3342834 RepID=UPI0035BA9192
MERGWCVHRSEWNWTAFVKIDVWLPDRGRKTTIILYHRLASRERSRRVFLRNVSLTTT